MDPRSRVSTPVRFWLDPLCPFCWTTSQWLRSVAAERDLSISYQPISLLVKNQIGDDSPWYGVAKWRYGLLRVLESVRAVEGETAFDDESFDDELLRRHHEGLALVGNDVGTPIIGVPGRDGGEVGVFGPVITALPNRDDALALWDATFTLARLPEFFELKRTRTSGPNPGERP